MRTERVVLGTLVTALARRRPWIVARQAAAIDQLSAGRMVLGVGLGDTGEHVLDDASLTRFGEVTNPAVRAEILDEALDIITGLWTGRPFSYHGRHHTVDGVTFVPRPVQRPRIPIWVGGGYPNRGPTRRAARWDGACMYGTEQHDLQPEQVRALRDAAVGRPYDVCVGGRPRRNGDRSWLSAVAAAGATWWAEYVPPGDPAEMRDMIQRGPLRIE